MSLCWYFTIFLLLVQVGEATEAQPSDQTKSWIGLVANSAPSLIMSTQEKVAFKKYLQIVGIEKYEDDASVTGSNRGLESYFNNLWNVKSRSSSQTNKCYQDMAVHYYKDVAAKLKSATCTTISAGTNTNDCKSETNKEKLIQYISNSDYQRLSTRAGDNEHKNLEPGWAWKLALKHANGNPRIAMHLIGMCGHDNVIRGDFGFLDKSDSAKEELDLELRLLRTEKQKLEAQLKSANIKGLSQQEFNEISKKFSALLEKIKKIESQDGKVRNLNCPPGSSDFYLAGSLDANADISAELKNKVSSIQNPNGNLKIQSKYYHVYASAFLACELISNGFDPQKAVTVQKQMARAYRSVIMCNKTSSALDEGQDLERLLNQKNPNKLDSSEDFLLESLNLIDEKLRCKSEKGLDQEKCTFLQETFQSNLSAMKKDKNIARIKIQNALARIDAAKLYRSWFLGGGSVLGQKIPCTDVRLWGPKNLMDANNSLIPIVSRPLGWSKDRYDRAAKHLATWEIDFEWTTAQHEAGAQFAAKNCKKGNPDENVLENVCNGQSNTLKTLSPNFKNTK